MLKEDGDIIGNPNALPSFTENYIRVLPTLSAEYTNPIASTMKAEFARHIADAAAPEDDPVYVELHGQYVGKILYDFETRSNAKLFRIVSIQFVRSFTAGRYNCWEATCEPVVRDPATGQFRVPAEIQVPGSNVTLTHALQGYCLAEYVDGLDSEPTLHPWVQNYIDHFVTVITPKFENIGMDLPSDTPKDSSSEIRKDSPSLVRTPRSRTRLPSRASHKFQTK